MRIGRIEQVIGPVVDVAFPVENGVPDIHHALVVTRQPVSEAMDLSDVDLSHYPGSCLRLRGWGGADHRHGIYRRAPAWASRTGYRPLD